MQAFFFNVFAIITGLYILVMLICIIAWILQPVFSAVKKVSTSVTVIVVARNEEKNISNCLNDIISQSFEKSLLEVIVVDDYSTDNTAGIIQKLSEEHSFIKYLKSTAVQHTKSFKKHGIEQAINYGKGHLIVTTDADCRMGCDWLTGLVSFYEKYKPCMIAGPVCITAPDTVFQKFQSVEFAGLTLVSAASIFMKMPIMCNGANLAYPREIFNKVNGFGEIDNIASGDDVLLMNKISSKFPGTIRFIKSRNVIVYTQALHSAGEFLNQRLRWSSKATAPGNPANFLLALLVYIFNFSVLTGIVASFLIEGFFEFYLPFVLSAFLINFLLLILGLSFYGVKKYWWLIIPEQPLYIIYIIWVGFLGVVKKQYSWKERKLV